MSGFQHDIAGGQGNLIATSVQSPNFVTGSAGWQIRKDGSAEFNNGTFRGVITAGGIFFYTGTPALGNLPIFSVCPPGTTLDPFGNGVVPTVTIGQLSGGHWHWDASGNLDINNNSAQLIATFRPTDQALLFYKPGGGLGNLLISLASAAGTDQFGNAYAQGLNVTAGTITGAQIVVFGSTGELLVYSGTPATGNLIGSWSALAGTDSHSNSFLDGLTVGTPAAGRIQLTVNASNEGVLRTLVPGFTSGALVGFSAGTFAQTALQGPAHTAAGHTDFCDLNFNSSDGTSSANLSFFYIDPSGAAHQYGTLDDNGLNILAGSITAAQPGTHTPASPAVPETWHTITVPATGTNVTAITGVARCKFVASPSPAVLVDVRLAFTSTGDWSMTLGSMPAGYYPLFQRRYPGGLAGTVTTDSAARLFIPATSGALQVLGPNGAGTFDATQLVPLD